MRCQLEFMRPAGGMLPVQIKEGLRYPHRIHQPVWVFSRERQSASAGRIDITIDDDVRDMDAVFGIFLRQDLGECSHHNARVVKRLAELPSAAAQRIGVV